jgi:hypothetical protein
MATEKLKTINPQKEEMRHSHYDNWKVMKPFVKFSFKTIKVIGITLIAIVRAAISTLKPHNKSTEVKRR